MHTSQHTREKKKIRFIYVGALLYYSFNSLDLQLNLTALVWSICRSGC